MRRRCGVNDGLPHHIRLDASDISSAFTLSQHLFSHPEYLPQLTPGLYTRNLNIPTMAGKKGGGENSKKAAGQARKAEAAAQKQAAKDRQAEEAEAEKWSKGSKSTAKA